MIPVGGRRGSFFGEPFVSKRLDFGFEAGFRVH